MDQNQKIFLHCLNLIPELGPKRIFLLLKKFQFNPQKIWQANYQELKKTGLAKKYIEKFLEKRKQTNLEKEKNQLKKLEIKILCHPKIIKNNSYPKSLTELATPPPILYLLGKFPKNFPFRLAIVGSRKVSTYGKQATEEIAYQIALNKIVIVSGLALGVDALAHQAALKAKAPTIAVLANGLDKVYPRSNYNLAQQILEQNGAIISEFPPYTPPLKQHFPQRNRLISGLAKAVLITEAALKSGSLITATHALDQNRDVFAIPGNIYNTNSQGTNNLIKQGAKLINKAEDVLNELNLQNAAQYVKTNKILPASPIQQKIYDNLSKKPIYIDELIKKIKLPAQEINSAITLMEIKGLIKNLGGGQYILI